MKPITILYSPDEDTLNEAYSHGYRIVGVVYVPERGTRVYMQQRDLSEAAQENMNLMADGAWHWDGTLNSAGIAELYPSRIEKKGAGSVYYRIKDADIIP